MQEAFDGIFVQLDADDSISVRWHRNEAVRHAIVLTAAVIGPEIRNLMLQKRFDSVRSRDRMPNGSILVKFVIRKSVDDGIAFEQGCDNILGRDIGRELTEIGFVGDLKHAFAIDLPLPQKRKQIRNERAQEARTFCPARFGFPAKQFFDLSIDGCHDFRGMGGTPLGEEVGDFEIFDSRPAANIDPFSEFIEVETIDAITQRYIDELRCCPFASDERIQGRRKDRSQDHIDPVFGGHLHVVFDDLPMPPIECLCSVVIHQAIAVEPLGIDQVLFRQNAIDDFQMEYDACNDRFVLEIRENEFDRENTRFVDFSRIDLDQ